jgi:hypothetical protein
VRLSFRILLGYSPALACKSAKYLAEATILSKSVTLGLVAVAALLLWGCSTDSGTGSAAGGGCPDGAVLAEAASVTKLKPGGGKDPTDVMLTAEMAKPNVSCDYDKDSGKVDVRFNFPVIVKRGPAATSAPQTLSYFVAVVDTDNNVVTKRTFSRDLTLDQATMSFNEAPEDAVFTVAKDKKPVAYEVLVGFQLTQDELAYNRAQRRYMP